MGYKDGKLVVMVVVVMVCIWMPKLDRLWWRGLWIWWWW